MADKMSGLGKWNLEGSVQASKVRVRAGARAFSERGRGETARAAKGSEAKAVQWSEGSRGSPEESQQTSTAKQESGRLTEVNRQLLERDCKSNVVWANLASGGALGAVRMELGEWGGRRWDGLGWRLKESAPGQRNRKA